MITIASEAWTELQVDTASLRLLIEHGRWCTSVEASEQWKRTRDGSTSDESATNARHICATNNWEIRFKWLASPDHNNNYSARQVPYLDFLKKSLATWWVEFTSLLFFFVSGRYNYASPFMRKTIVIYLQSLVQVVIIHKIDYCNSVLVNIPDSTLHPHITILNIVPHGLWKGWSLETIPTHRSVYSTGFPSKLV